MDIDDDAEVTIMANSPLREYDKQPQAEENKEEEEEPYIRTLVTPPKQQDEKMVN